LGLAQATLDAFLDLASTKTPRGVQGLLRDQPLTQAQVGEADAILRSARAFLRQSVGDVWEAVCRSGQLTMTQRVLIRQATTHAIQCGAQVVDTAYHAAGATAIFRGNPFERRFRDVHAVMQQIQGRREHYETVGKFLLGLEPDTQWL
jgi:alkylation response protein AidB-like acyl-CoA dehydrogenase